jgi:outer membrane protein, multidrug efflux system
MRKKILRALFFGLLCSLTSCQLEPPYEPPNACVALNWKNVQSTPSSTPPLENWWEVFHDPVLNSLEETALANNPFLAAACERVEQARDLAKIVRSELFPQIDLTPCFTNKGVLIETFNLSGNEILRAHKRKYALPVILTYEVDLWSKLKDRYKSAVLQAEAQEAAYYFVLLLLTTDLAHAYFQARIQDTLTSLLEKTIETRKTALAINQSRFDEKIADFTPVAFSKLDLSLVETDYLDAKRLRALFENQLAVLCGLSPSLFHLDFHPIDDEPPTIPAGLPATMLLRRPDLWEKERLMAAFHAQIGVAYASFFPSIELIARGGSISPISKDFLTNFSRYWMMGIKIFQYIFDARARYYNLKMTWAEFREAADLYQEQILIAFQDVEDALSDLAWFAEQRESAEEAVRSARRAYTIAFDRYLEGAFFYLPVADDERQLLDNQRLYVSLLGASYASTIHLIKALGGGWEGDYVCR